MKDLLFHYKYICRFLLIQKIGYLTLSTHHISKISKVVAFFSVKDLVDFEDLRNSNYFFLLKFHFGRRAFILNYKTEFSLNILYHSFIIQFISRGNNVYFPIIFILDDFKFCLTKKSFIISRYKNTLNFKVLDMNIFLERKTNVGFFNLKDKLNVKFFCSGPKLQGKYLFYLLKLT
jgi:hypothetical protein